MQRPISCEIIYGCIMNKERGEAEDFCKLCSIVHIIDRFTNSHLYKICLMSDCWTVIGACVTVSYTSNMILRKVTRTALSITLGQHYIRGHLTLTENHFNSTEESKNFDSIVGSNPRNDASISRLF